MTEPQVLWEPWSGPVCDDCAEPVESRGRGFEYFAACLICGKLGTMRPDLRPAKASSAKVDPQAKMFNELLDGAGTNRLFLVEAEHYGYQVLIQDYKDGFFTGRIQGFRGKPRSWASPPPLPWGSLIRLKFGPYIALDTGYPVTMPNMGKKIEILRQPYLVRLRESQQRSLRGDALVQTTEAFIQAEVESVLAQIDAWAKRWLEDENSRSVDLEGSTKGSEGSW